jgi:hypothetical protein
MRETIRGTMRETMKGATRGAMRGKLMNHVNAPIHFLDLLFGWCRRHVVDGKGVFEVCE